MRRLALLMAWLAFPVLLVAQGTQHNNYAQSIGPSNSVRAIPFATVSVCNGTTLPAAGTACSPLSSTIFTNPALSIASPNPITADATANYNFWTAGGASYVISVAAPGFITYSYSWTAPISSATTVTGSPVAGELTIFSSATAITNGNLSGDVSTSNTTATTLASSIAGAKTFTGGLLAGTFTSTSANPAASGVLRLASGDAVGWRNNANSGDLLLSKNVSDQLLYNADQVVTATATQTLTNKTLAVGSISPGTNGQCVNTSGGAAVWGSCSGVAGVQLIGTPVFSGQVNANSTAIQVVSAACASTPCYSAGALNVLNKTIDMESIGTVAFLNSSVTFQMGMGFNGTAATVVDNIATTSTSGFYDIRANCTVISTGVSGQFNCSGVLTFTDSNHATIVRSFTLLNGGLTYDLTGTLSPNAAVKFNTGSASNVFTQGYAFTHQHN